ncbi:MAG: DUF2716 domain-containing protein [Planctomycetota bacterium]
MNNSHYSYLELLRKETDPSRRREMSLAHWEREREKEAAIGWHEIQDREEKECLFDRLDSLFASGQPRVPGPFATWDVTAAINLPCRSAERLFLIDDLHRKCLPALKCCYEPGNPWYVFENYNHLSYRLHFEEMPAHIDQWPVEILPYGDPCYLLAPDFSSGIIAVLHQSITVFGSLLPFVRRNLPLAFTHIVQSDDWQRDS